MKWLPALVAVVLVVPAVADEETGKLPVVDGQPLLASVNGEPITAEDLRWRIGSMHQGMEAAEGMIRKPDTSGLLERVINAKLIVQEARQIGLDELPEISSTLEMGRRELLKRFMIDERLEGIYEGDPTVVEQIYREIVQEFKIQSALFQTSEDATAFETTVRGGTKFEQAIGHFTESGKATVQQGPFLKVREMRPEVAAVLRDLEPGAVTTPVDVPGGVAVIQLLEIRLPDDAEARATAEETALTYRQQDDLRAYTQELRDRYVQVIDKVRDSLDFDSPDTDLEAYRNDERVLAKVKGSKPVTVAELTKRVNQQLYHGLGQSTNRKRINDKLDGVLDRMVLERATELETKRLGIEKRPEFASARTAQEDSVLFGAFVSRVVNPDIKVPDDEVVAFYNAHLDEYMTSAMVRLQSLPFEDLAHAEAGQAKLLQGSDLNWIRANADGVVVEPEDGEVLLKFEGRVLALAALPEGVREAVEGASAGDVRLFAQPEGRVYVLSVEEIFPAQPQEFADVRDQVLQRAFVQKREQAIDKWTDELRKVSEIEIHASDEQIRQILWMELAGDK